MKLHVEVPHSLDHLHRCPESIENPRRKLAISIVSASFVFEMSLFRMSPQLYLMFGPLCDFLHLKVSRPKRILFEFHYVTSANG
jgi:hypothetical protein